MAKQKKRRGTKWIQPTKATGRRKERYCRICGSLASQVAIMKHENICEFCAKELAKKREGRLACKACGKVVPKQVQKLGGYCKECVCTACGKPDPEYTRKHGFCRNCFETVGAFCAKCGKEAMAQVTKNKGLCDACAAKARGNN